MIAPLPRGARTWRDLPAAELEPHSIGGTDAAALLGLCPPSWQGATPWGMYLQAQGHGRPEPSEAQLIAMERGTLLEGPILTAVEDRLGVAGETGLMLRHDAAGYRWAVGTPDAVSWVDPAEGIEIKTDLRSSHWGPDGTVIPRWTRDAADLLPAHYAVQVSWYLELSGLDRWHVAVLTPGTLDRMVVAAAALMLEECEAGARDLARAWRACGPTVRGASHLRILTVERDPDIQSDILATVSELRQRHLVNGEPPPVDGTPDCAAALAMRLRPDRTRSVRPSGELEDAARTLVAARRAARKATAEAEYARNRLLAHIGDARRVVLDAPPGGRPTVVSVSQAGTVTVSGGTP